MKGLIMMNTPLMAAGIAGGVFLAGAGAAAVGALTLFNRVIPRQEKIRVNLDEFADMAKWEEYKKIIHPNKEWIMSRPMEHITLTARDGITLHGDLISSDEPSDRLLIAFHGYTSCGLSDCSSISSYFIKHGYDALIVDARAHGKSGGDYAGFGILDRYDCMSWIRYINDRFNGEKQIVLYGVSMGGATVLMTSGFSDIPDNVRAVIADCAFTSPYDVFAHVLKKDYKLPPFPIMNINDELCRRKAGYGFNDYSTLEAMRETKIPTLFVHGKNDKFVPVWMTEKNYSACRAPKELLMVENAGHGSSYYENVPLYESKVTEFLGKYVGWSG